MEPDWLWELESREALQILNEVSLLSPFQP